MKRLLLIICILLIPATAHAEWFSWDDKNTELSYYTTALMVIDLGQTLYTADNPNRYYEKHNFYLDKHPSRTEVKQYFGGYFVLLNSAVFVLPPGWSHALQKFIIIDEVYGVGTNIRLNVGFGF